MKMKMKMREIKINLKIKIKIEININIKTRGGFTDRMAKKGIEIITINYSLITSFFACPNRALEREGLGGCARTSVACKTKSETGKPRVSAGSSPRGFTARLLRMAM